MKARLVALCPILVALQPVVAPAQVPDSISYQGYLEDSEGPVDDPATQLTFRLYRQAEDGDAIWTETHSGVTVQDGVFAVALGSVAGLSDIPFDKRTWVSVAVGDASATELAPRTALTSVPYALSLRGLRVEPSAAFEYAPNLIGGYWKNGATPGVNSATVGGGGAFFAPNTVGATAATVGGGIGNSALGLYSTVSGGMNNWAPGGTSMIPGGAGNNATGEASFAAGFYGHADHDGTFVWSDRSLTSSEPFVSTGENQFLIRAAGGVGINTNVLPLSPLSVQGIIESRVGGFKFPDGTVQSSAAVAAARSWVLNGNAGTDYEDDFVGTTDNQPLVLRVNGDVAMTIMPTSGTPSITGGHESNLASREGGVVAGGGSATSPNEAQTPFSTVSGGLGNTAGLSGGQVGNYYYATVGGGHNNEANHSNSTVGGGRDNLASGSESTVGGGDGNAASATASVVGGGSDNVASVIGATVSGGYLGEASAQFTVVGGGYQNRATGAYSVVAGGVNNQASASYSTIAGGGSETVANGNRVTDTGGAVGGGYRNRAGNNNADTGDAPYSTVSGGDANLAHGGRSFVGGGFSNQANGNESVVAGGWSNHADGQRSFIGGGRDNRAGGLLSMIPGGSGNFATGNYSFAAGRYARANNQGCFVWADNSTTTPLDCNNDNRLLARAAGGVYLYTNNLVTTGAYLAAGGSSWNSLSDRSRKTGFQRVDGRMLLERLAETDISTWTYVDQDPSIRHVGPTAQDFNELVPGLGGEGERYINSLDADGIALAAIKGLYELVKVQETRIESLEAELKRIREEP